MGDCVVVTPIPNQEALRLEYQMNQFMRQKKKKDFQPSYFTRGNGCNTMEEIEDHINKERDRYNQKKKTWKTMIKSEQWTLIKRFLDDNGFQGQTSKYRSALLKGTLDVELDSSNNVKDIKVIGSSQSV